MRLSSTSVVMLLLSYILQIADVEFSTFVICYQNHISVAIELGIASETFPASPNQ